MRVRNAKYVKDYKIKIIFNNGVVKIVDFKPLLKDAKNLFTPLLNVEYFKSFSVDDTTICWPNEVDFCPDVLYEIGKDIKETAKKTSHKSKTKISSISEKTHTRIAAKSKD